jgi:hypothetical protein
MGFDDLARHMAARDGKKKLSEPVGSADEIMAAAAEADRKMARTRDRVLGLIMLVGGAFGLLLYVLYLFDANDPTPDPNRPPKDGYYLAFPYLPPLLGGAMVYGAWRVIRSFRRAR